MTPNKYVMRVLSCVVCYTVLFMTCTESLQVCLTVGDVYEADANDAWFSYPKIHIRTKYTNGYSTHQVFAGGNKPGRGQTKCIGDQNTRENFDFADIQSIEIQNPHNDGICISKIAFKSKQSQCVSTFTHTACEFANELKGGGNNLFVNGGADSNTCVWLDYQYKTKVTFNHYKKPYVYQS